MTRTPSVFTLSSILMIWFVAALAPGETALQRVSVEFHRNSYDAHDFPFLNTRVYHVVVLFFYSDNI